jgi:hypothetical protein
VMNRGKRIIEFSVPYGEVNKRNLSWVPIAEQFREIAYDYLTTTDKCPETLKPIYLNDYLPDLDDSSTVATGVLY